jgi:catecholate siderophore receptor
MPFASLFQTIVLLSAAAAQAQRVPLHGTVLDPSRAPVAGARVAARACGPSVATSTDDQGRFRLGIEPRGCTIEVKAPGFRPLSEVVRPAGEGEPAREFVLEVAPVRESVTVEGSAGYRVEATASATRTSTALRDVPQSVTVVTRELIRDQVMSSMADVVRYVPGVGSHQGENNRDQVVIRGNSSSADFFVNGVRDDVQYYRDLYNVERVEALKGPNAMIFGRGGGGGVINRVTKEAEFGPLRSVSAQSGSFAGRRLAADFNQPLTRTLAFRVNGMFEDADSFRDSVSLRRYGVNPTLTLAPRDGTRVTLSYEHLHDTRVADRGITSWQGLPADVDTATYYGDPTNSPVGADVDLLAAGIEHRAGRLSVRNRTLAGDYDRRYQNYVPGAVSSDRSSVALTAYNNATGRRNLFNQTDLVLAARTGAVRHTLLAGLEVGRQLTDNLRHTGYFDGTATSIQVPYEAPRTSLPMAFRQSATDADNHVEARVAAAYVQDQVELAKALQLVAGLRFDRFDLRYHNNRNGDGLGRVDELVSPRLGVVVKPLAALSLYASYSVSHLPSSGDQFSSLTVISEQLEPERFRNHEAGAKWDLARDLSVTAAVYRLDRTNTRSTDPNDPARIVQTGSQRTSGCELGVNGQITRAWRIAGGYAYQDAVVTSATVAARAGARVGQVPRHTFSLWNSYQLAPRLAAGLGVVHRTDMYAAVDDTVTLPGYTRLDAAAFYDLGRSLRIQANVENLLDRRYYVNADGNTNISPGRPRSARVSLVAAF